jgi:hypothetical protein
VETKNTPEKLEGFSDGLRILFVRLGCFCCCLAVHYIGTETTSDNAIIYIEQSGRSIMILDGVESDQFSDHQSRDFTYSCSSSSHYDVPKCTRPALTFIANSEVSEAMIPEDNELFFSAYSCAGSIGTPQLILYVRSVWGFLPKEHFPMLPIAWIETVYYTILLVLCVINRVQHKSSGLVIQNLIFVTIFFALFMSILTGSLYTTAGLKRGCNHLSCVSEWLR